MKVCIKQDHSTSNSLHLLLLLRAFKASHAAKTFTTIGNDLQHQHITKPLDDRYAPAVFPHQNSLNISKLVRIVSTM